MGGYTAFILLLFGYADAEFYGLGNELKIRIRLRSVVQLEPGVYVVRR